MEKRTAGCGGNLPAASVTPLIWLARQLSPPPAEAEAPTG